MYKTIGIRIDLNDWSKVVGNPRYVFDLLLSIINVSVQTVEIVELLPNLSFYDKKN
jgi:predicted helicase